MNQDKLQPDLSKLRKMEEAARRYRGMVIHEITFLEKFMEAYCCQFFARDNQRYKDLNLIVFGDNRMSFESKRQIFEKISEKYDSDWIKSFPAPGVKKTLIRVQEARNIFAHLLLTSDPETINNFDDVLSFWRFKDDVKTFDYREGDINEIVNLTQMLTTFIYNRLQASDFNSKYPV